MWHCVVGSVVVGVWQYLSDLSLMSSVPTLMVFDSLTQKVKGITVLKTSPTVTLQHSITPQKVQIFRKRKIESLQKGTGLFSDFM